MGQYYKACYKADKGLQWKGYTPWDVGHGSKLMEHSYISNYFVNQIMEKAFRSPKRIVWAGDYADNEDHKSRNLYDSCRNVAPIKKIKHDEFDFRFIINHDKKVFIDLNKVKPSPSTYGYRIHPLPLLTAEGNGRGGGDYHGNNEAVGTWARDLIEVDRHVVYTDYTEVEYDFNDSL